MILNNAKSRLDEVDRRRIPFQELIVSTATRVGQSNAYCVRAIEVHLLRDGTIVVVEKSKKMEAPHDFSIVNTPLPMWSRVVQAHGGWLYMILNGDLLKVGKTTQPARRLRAAQTWLPNGELIGIKPFWDVHMAERTLLCGLANCWVEGEWHRFPDQEMYDNVFSDFRMFDDHDRNRNSVDFHYWIGSSGMGEVIMAQNHRGVSLRQWQREA